MNMPVEREKLEAVLKLLNHSSLDDSDEVNEAFNIVQGILFDNPIAGEELKEPCAVYLDEYGRLFRVHDDRTQENK
jgi:hypothetical protein